jgi:hypothetical protein
MSRRAGCTPDIAFDVWIKNGKPSMRRLKDILSEQGYSVHNQTLSNWKDRHVEWQAAYAAIKAPITPGQIIATLETAERVAPVLKTEHFMGVKAQLVARLFASIEHMPITSVADLREGIDCCERLEGLIHAERGKTVIESNSISRPSGGLADRLGTVVPGPFKKPVATAGGGNGANGAGGH